METSSLIYLWFELQTRFEEQVKEDEKDGIKGMSLEALELVLLIHQLKRELAERGEFEY